MASLRLAWDRLKGERERNYDPVSWDQWLSYFSFGGSSYALSAPSQTLVNKQELPLPSLDGYTQTMFRSSSITFSCMALRMRLFSEARFKFRELASGRPGRLYGNTDLVPLEKPWPNGTTGDLLTRMIQDADIAGNFYGYAVDGGIKRLRPDWVTIVLGSQQEPNEPGIAADCEVVGYIYRPPQASTVLALLPEQVCHFAPIPDPLAHFRGMSWLTPLIREVMADSAATSHKLAFFENGATPNMVVSLDPGIRQAQFDEWIATFRGQHEGILNAYKTLYLGGGAKVDVVGANMRQIDFKLTQGAGETRICSAAGIPPICVGASEGLASATYSNYSQAQRALGDITMRPLWREASASLSPLITVPNGSELWYDDRDIPFLKNDIKDASAVQAEQASTLHTLITAGFDPDTAIQAVISGDFSKLTHTGMLSVQLTPIGAIGEGKGSLVSGAPVLPNGQPAVAPATNGAPPVGS